MSGVMQRLGRINAGLKRTALTILPSGFLVASLVLVAVLWSRSWAAPAHAKQATDLSAVSMLSLDTPAAPLSKSAAEQPTKAASSDEMPAELRAWKYTYSHAQVQTMKNDILSFYNNALTAIQTNMSTIAGSSLSEPTKSQLLFFDAYAIFQINALFLQDLVFADYLDLFATSTSS